MLCAKCACIAPAHHSCGIFLPARWGRLASPRCSCWEKSSLGLCWLLSSVGSPGGSIQGSGCAAALEIPALALGWGCSWGGSSSQGSSSQRHGFDREKPTLGQGQGPCRCGVGLWCGEDAVWGLGCRARIQDPACSNRTGGNPLGKPKSLELLLLPGSLGSSRGPRKGLQPALLCRVGCSSQTLPSPWEGACVGKLGMDKAHGELSCARLRVSMEPGGWVVFVPHKNTSLFH